MALAAAAFAVGIAAGTTGEQDHSSSRASVSALRSSPKTTARTTPKRPVVHTHTVTVTHASPPPPTHTVTAQATPAAATTPAPPTADTLEARGHQLMVGGQYTSAIPLLEHAVSTASPASLTYAYALFDLGHSLRMAGDLPAAAAILQRRLAIPNQTEVVRQELQITLRQIGAQAQSSPTGGAPAGPPKHRKH